MTSRCSSPPTWAAMWCSGRRACPCSPAGASSEVYLHAVPCCLCPASLSNVHVLWASARCEVLDRHFMADLAGEPLRVIVDRPWMNGLADEEGLLHLLKLVQVRPAALEAAC